jgi:hypothetical protein
MTTATMWADTSNAMWIGFALFAVGAIIGGVIMYRAGRRR